MNEIMNDFPDAKTLYTECINSPKYENLSLLNSIKGLILQASREGKFYADLTDRKKQLPREIIVFLRKIKGYKVFESEKKKREFGITEHYYDYKISLEDICNTQ